MIPVRTRPSKRQTRYSPPWGHQLPFRDVTRTCWHESLDSMRHAFTPEVSSPRGADELLARAPTDNPIVTRTSQSRSLPLKSSVPGSRRTLGYPGGLATRPCTSAKSNPERGCSGQCREVLCVGEVHPDHKAPRWPASKVRKAKAAFLDA